MKRIIGKFVLKNRIYKYVRKLPIDERFKPLITDIVLRRAVQYNRNYGELRTDLEALVNNFERVRIVPKSKMSIHNYALAVYCGADKEILISEDTLNESPERIYQIFAHELFHVMLKNNRGVDRFDKFNYMLGMRSNLYQELIAEKGSYRLTYPVENDYSGYNCNVFGYEDISFVLDFIEAAYGVNEQDVLKHALNGRRDLAKFLAEVAGEETYEAEQFLDEMEVGGTLLLSTLYDDGDARTNRPKSREEVDENILAGIDSMFSVCQSKIEERLRNADIDSLEDAEALKDEIAFSEFRLINILKNRLKYFRDELGTDVDKLWDRCLGDYSEDVVSRLCDIEQLLADTEMKQDILKIEGIRAVRGYTFDDDEFYQRFLLTRPSRRSFKTSKAIINDKKELSMYTEGWKNKRIIKIVKSIIESEQEKSTKTHLIALNLVYEAQPSERSSMDIYKLTDEQKQTYEEDLKDARAGNENQDNLELIDDIDWDNDKNQ